MELGKLKISKQQNNISFGWLPKTHEGIIECALNSGNFPNLKKYENTLKEFVKKPDWDEANPLWILGSRHDYCYNKKNSGSGNYIKHIIGMFSAIKNKNSDLFIEHLARAAHYLEDMTLSLHTQKKSLLDGITKFVNHFEFEKFIQDRQGILLGQSVYSNKSKVLKTSTRDFAKLFLDNINFSSKRETPKSSNKINWSHLGKEGLDKAVESTMVLFEKAEKMFYKFQPDLQN